ncbi:GGDEF domain-containing protein [Edaphobacter bradus]|uniref:GGDEF domain-containing protein n=1 Tax=Edaphobacter bradus TaxID=2259016 RepID=UPI0021E01E12|nr:GGDEF domain-containing protein [Edaphobacter bradus]
MNVNLLPDLAALAALLAVLHFLRRRHPQERVGLWIIGLLFIFLEAIAHTLYADRGPRHMPSHIVALDSYLAAGIIFLWAAARPLYSRRSTLIYLLANTPPLALLLTIYGLDLRTQPVYRIVIICGQLVGVLSPFLIARTVRLRAAWWLIVTQLLIWTPLWFSVASRNYRETAYFPLFVVYLATGVVFQLSLPRRSLGKICIVAGFTLWALVFLFHSWVAARPQYTDFAAQIWNMQKFLVTIGMLLVLLELQVSSNEWYAFHDQLTGLPNRRLFEDRLAQSLDDSARSGTRTALIMLDLNGFKQINDSLGHDVGDRLLQQVAHSLRHAIREPDTLARLGGDEFIIVAGNLPAAVPAEQIVEASARRIEGALRRSFYAAGYELAVSGSVGVAIYPDDTTDEVLLRRLADQRMYSQKRQVPLQFEPELQL